MDGRISTKEFELGLGDDMTFEEALQAHIQADLNGKCRGFDCLISRFLSPPPLSPPSSLLMFLLVLIINLRIISLLVLFSNIVLVIFRSPLSNISFAHKTFVNEHSMRIQAELPGVA